MSWATRRTGRGADSWTGWLQPSHAVSAFWGGGARTPLGIADWRLWIVDSCGAEFNAASFRNPKPQSTRDSLGQRHERRFEVDLVLFEQRQRVAGLEEDAGDVAGILRLGP